MGSSPLDITAAHAYFSVDCFNRAWALLERTERSSADEQRMIELGIVSLWHWTQRDDCSDTNMSIGYWLASRIYSTVGRDDEARRYAVLCLGVSRRPNVPEFYAGYAYEAMARSELVAGDAEAALEHVRASRRIANGLTDPAHREQLLVDLNALARQLGRVLPT